MLRLLAGMRSQAVPRGVPSAPLLDEVPKTRQVLMLFYPVHAAQIEKQLSAHCTARRGE